MSAGIWFWLLFVLTIVFYFGFGFYAHHNPDIAIYSGTVNSLVPMILIGLLGYRVFGKPVQ